MSRHHSKADSQINHDSSICSKFYSSHGCCSRAIENELSKRSAVEVNSGYRSYIAFCKKEVQNLSKNLKYFIDFKFADIGNALIELKCQNRLADMPHRSYLECLRDCSESVSEVMESFVRFTFMHNDTFDGAAAFFFNLMLSLRVTRASSQNSSQ
ncbi:hypothetical protein TcWFU_005876 [Taenia crassiceps]|uniref:Uncharacterized protein n=1 Tax=Taenia crassiceps TaxID=6207 RepID=A0ABR4Q6F3_9CEST